MRRSALLLLPLALAACGSGAKHITGPPPVNVHLYGRGASRVWIFAPDVRPKLVVLFVHGLGSKREATPYYHRPWLMHLAREGYEVVYPGYETFPVPARRPEAPRSRVSGVAAVARGEGRAGRPRSGIRAAGGW